jgi:hypothetical protein
MALLYAICFFFANVAPFVNDPSRKLRSCFSKRPVNQLS